MNMRAGLVALGKLVLAGAAFSIGMIAGGMLATLLQLPPPAIPQGMDTAAALRNFVLESPLLALALALLARDLGGRFVTRALALSFLTWIAYTVNTQLEASIFTTMASGLAFSLVDFAVPSLFCGTAVAFLFPYGGETASFAAAAREFFARRTAGAWVWRLAVAALAFMPIYWFFGTLVVPFTGAYYQQNQFGLTMPGVDQILAVLFIRSLLFLAACLPVLILWRGSNRSLFASLGSALFVLVGLLYMLGAEWMPVAVRLPHTLEILVDEFVYAGVLVWLLRKESPVAEPSRSAVRRAAVG
ncbi:MAG: hypothetical protein M1132_03350 [Chloroflexi bacterium]|nr:hypothetical protein [Chloroflexota bacterium]